MKTKRIIKDQKGGALIEFAIVLPLLVLLVIGAIEFGILCYNKQVIANASREGARAGIVQRVDDDGNLLLSNVEVEALIDGIVQSYCSQRLITFGSNNPPTVASTGENGAFQQDLIVDVEYNYGFLIPSLFGLGDIIHLSAETVMSMEAIPS
ncbi:MAG: pilus assembly protein [Deltaproteobacteria bacterium]|nr:pilus assembly protein [Deltaproteobacteria bacterium]MBW2642606.1 pilus assembly protein [Deltaproteobacteria bacterium]